MANTYAERWVRTLRHELLDRTIIWNQRQLRHLIDDYIDHYNGHCPHPLPWGKPKGAPPVAPMTSRHLQGEE